MALNNSITASSSGGSSNSRCSACLTIQTNEHNTTTRRTDNDTATYTSMDPRPVRPPNLLPLEDIEQPSCSTSSATKETCSKQRSGHRLSLTSIGLNLRRAKSFNFKTKRSATASSTSSNSKKQANNTNSASGLGPIVSSLSLSPKWPLRFSCTSRREQKQQKEQKVQQQTVSGATSEGCCRCVCYKPLASVVENVNASTSKVLNLNTIESAIVNAAAAVCSSMNNPKASNNSAPSALAGAASSSLDKSNNDLEQQQTSVNRLCAAPTPSIDSATTGVVDEQQSTPTTQLTTYSSAAAISGSSVVQLVSNAIVILEEERERNRTMAAMAMAAMNGVVTTGSGGGGIYGGGGGVGEVWEPLFHIPCMSNSVGQLGGSQQQLIGQQHEDCDESARRQRAREIEQGVDPPANYRSTTTGSHIGGVAGGGGGGTRRVQLLCGDNTASDQQTADSSISTTTRRLQIVCPSDLPVDSLRALFQDHVTLRSCPLDSSWTGCHTQVDFVHCLVPDLLSISRCTFYWGKMDRYEAERLLDGKPEGTFLLRDSAQEEFLFSVSFRKYGRSLHARIEQWNHKFSFDSHDPGVYTSDTVCGLIEHYKDPSSCMFFEPVLTWPLHRNFTFTLQHLSRAVITSRLQYDDVNQLQLPKALKSYLKEYHYRQKVRVERFDDCGPSEAVQWLVNTNSAD